MHDLYLGQRIVPAPGFEEQLAEGLVRLRQPDRGAGLIRQMPGLPGHGQRLLVPVELAQHDGLVDLQQQPQIGRRRIGLGHGQRLVEQRQRVGHLPLHGGHDRQHMQRPAHGPVVGCLRRGRERTSGDPASLLDLAEAEVRPSRRGRAAWRGAGPRARE